MGECCDADVSTRLDELEPLAGEVSTAELEARDYVVTMGCSTLSLDASADVRDWALPDPHGKPPERVCEISETVRERVRGIFDEIETDAS